MSFHYYVLVSESDLMDIAFPFPIQTELGIPIKTEAGEDICIDSGAVAILSLSAVISSPKLIVLTED